MLQSPPAWRAPKGRFDIEWLLARPEPARPDPVSVPLPPAAWPAPRLACPAAAALLPCAAAAAATVYLAEPPPPAAAAFLPPRPCAQPGCKRAVPGLELSQCPSAHSLRAPLPWRSGGPCKMKRVRTVFTPEQLERLEKEFLKQQYMVGTERVDLAATLHLTETQIVEGRYNLIEQEACTANQQSIKVKVWFQNRRIKWRKQSLEQKAAKMSQFGVTQPTSTERPEEQDCEEAHLEVEV